MSLYNFTIVNNQVTAFYEWDDGRWEPERIDFDETFEVSGNNVIRTEKETFYDEITTYAPNPNGNGYYKVSEQKVPHNTDPTPTPNPTPTPTPISDDLYKFTIVNGQVTEVYELDDGRWERENIDYDETYTVSGNNIIRTETDKFYNEITTYAPTADGSGYYVLSQEKTPIGQQNVKYSKLYAKSDLYKFDINNNQVITAYEFDDGRWEKEYKDPNETYSIVDENIVLTEVEGRWTETSIFSPVGDGTYRKVSENYTQTEQSSGNTKNYDNTDFSLFRLYKSVFDRTPDAPGFGYWQTEYKGHKMSWDGIVTSFLNSKEFIDTYGNTTNEQFVKLLYNNVLKRDPDADGNGYWLDQLNTGVIDREGVVNSFAQSQEFIAKTQSDALSFFDTI